MTEYLKRTWAEINLDNLEFNISQIRSVLPEKTKIMSVVKADGYGHGDRFIAQTLVKCGIDFFAVSNLEEALSLRSFGIESDILILGFTPVKRQQTLVSFNITQTVFSLEYARELNESCKNSNEIVDVHIKLDTGMSRIGILQSKKHSALSEIKEICNLSNLNVVGIFTHLSSADSLDSPSIDYTKMQTDRFSEILSELEKEGVEIPVKHLQNSAGIAFLKDVVYDYARAGIVMYGVAPGDDEVGFEIRPVMELKSVVSMVKEIDESTPVSYGRKYVADKKVKVATVPIGYADGYPRLLSNKGFMLINGKRANIIGNICMDQLMLDVSGVDDVKMGDIVTVVGKSGDEYIGFPELAKLVSSISYEMMCLIGRRVPRVYKKNNRTIAVVDYVNDKF